MGEVKPELKEATAEKLPTTSLTKLLIGFDGEPIKVKDLNEDGTVKASFAMDVRWAILMALKQGSVFAEQKKELNETDKLRCYILAQEVANPENVGKTFKPEDIILIKRLATLRLSVEPYGVLLEILDPTAFTT